MRQKSSLGNIDIRYKYTVGYTALIVILSLSGLIVSPGDPIILGFVLGSLVGVLNSYLLVRRIKKTTELVTENNMDAGSAKLHMQAGFFPRMGMIIAVVFLAGKISFINLCGLGLGLLLPTLVTVVEANVALYRYFAARNAVDKI